MTDISREKDIKLSTKEVASLFRVDGQTVRRSYCVNGHYLGLKPVKLSTGRLLWDSIAARKLLEPNSAADNKATEIA
jgi:hypothetical protein